MNLQQTIADRRFLAALAVLVLLVAAVALLAPSLVPAAIPLLIVAACPLSMVVMMRSMAGHQSHPSHRPDALDDGGGQAPD